MKQKRTQPTKPQGIWELANFQPRQVEAWEAMFKYRFILYGGTRGCAKSYFLRWASVLWTIYLSSALGEPVKTGLFTNTYPELRDRIIGKMAAEIPLAIGEVRESKEHGLGFHIRGEYGGGVVLLRNLDDPNKYKGAEFAAVFVDELTHVPTIDVFHRLRGSLRWPRLRHAVFVATANPGNAGHAWVKRLWIDKRMPPELKGREREFHFVKARPQDNKYLDEAYWEELRSLPPNLRRAWLEGDWDVFEGLAFPEFDPSVHVVDNVPREDHWPVWVGIDWGYAQPFAALWLTKDPNTGKIYVFHEEYHTMLTDREQARLIRAVDEMLRVRPYGYYADPALWVRNRQLNTLVYSTADVYAAEGVPLYSADNNRLDGKRRVDRLLAVQADGKPGLFIHSSCRHLIDQLSTLAVSERNPEDVNTRQEDHAYDALRYALSIEAGLQDKKRVERGKNPWHELARAGLL